MMVSVFRGRLVHSVKRDEKATTEIFPDAIIAFDPNDGKIVFVEPDASNINQLQQKYGFDTNLIHQLTPSQFLIPGFVDTHIHAPQYSFTGTSYDLQLRDWLQKYTFPTEAKFSDVTMARNVYDCVVKRTLNNGTTTASYFATIHLESTKELCKIIAKNKQRALVGKVNMDMKSPENYIETTEESIRYTSEFIEFVEDMKNPLICPVITPRSAPICSKELMEQLARLAASKNLHIQSHLCEQPGEIPYTLSCHPGHNNCLEIFDKVGLLNEKTYMAHCIHTNEEETKMLTKKKIGVAHCPISNFCLKSGFMNAREKLSKGIKIGLGTDVSGGYSSSIMEVMRGAMQTSNALYIKAEEESQKSGNDSTYIPLTLDEVFYMATMGGAEVLNMDNIIGNFQVGKQFDALLIDANAMGFNSMPVFDTFPSDTFEDIFSKFIYLGDDRNIAKVFVAGQEVIGNKAEVTTEALLSFD
jgi:guanine deaminase